MILAPMVGRKKASEKDLGEDSGTRLYGFRAAYVFDVSQTDGEPLPQFAKVTGEPGELLIKLKSLVVEQGITLEYCDSIHPAMGCSYGGRIALLPRLAPAEEFSTLVHEAAHELLHRGERSSQTNHVIRETEAEAVAYVVNTAIGLEPSTASADYIQLHSGDRDVLAESLSFVQQVSQTILKALTLSESIPTQEAA
jgi:hypothetical protein